MFIAFCKICILYSHLVFLLWCIRSGVVFVTKFALFIKAKCTIFIRKLFIRSDVNHQHIVRPSIRIVEHRIVNPDTHLLQEFDFIALEQWHIVRLSNCLKMGLVIDVMDCDGDFVFCVDILMDVRAFFTFPTRLTKQYLIDLAEDGEGAVILARDLELVLGVTGLYSDVLEPRIVLCTHWIRVIQRRWKRAFSERKRRLRMRGSILAQRRFELTGNYGVDTSTKGILRDFAICDFAICPGSTNTKIG